MPDIFGSAAGTSAAIGDMQKLAQTQLAQTANAKGQMELQQQQKMMELMQQNAAKPGEGQKSPVEQMEDMARLAMGAGLVTSGSKLATDASKIRLQEAQGSHAKAQTFNQQALAAKTELETVDRLLSGVNDQSSWESANSLFETMTGRPSPFKGVPYNPDLVQQLQQSTLTMKDRLDLHIKQQNADTQAQNSQSASSFREFRKGIMQDEVGIKRDREQRLAKTGGKATDMGVPVKSELDHAADSITAAFPNLPTDEVNNAAYSVASRARAIRKTTPGIDADQALDRAMAEAKASGAFQTVNDTYKIFGMDTGVGSGKTTHFKKSGNTGGGNTGNTAANPFTDIPPPGKRMIGGYYSHGGKVYQWNKGGWSAVGGDDASSDE